jgi:D-alanyl-lipoteichoic acid acyltransferase DltB (MBOAT superfamily)
LPLSFFIYFYLLQQRLIIGAKGFLVFASLFFYSWWNVAYLPIILSSMLFNYIIGNTLNDNLQHIKMHRKTLLAIGISANLALLGYFKYSDFFIKNFNVVFDTSIPLLHVMLPLAISFFTFQQIAYLVDSYRAETKEYDFLNYALFVTFFPQLIAGPIVHHSEMMPQFASKWNLVKKYKNIAAGLFIFCIGLFKKVVIADTFALWATNGFDIAQTLNMIEAWATSLSYTFQLYFDFSGYTDMAIGAALLFNIRLPINFNSPYKALSIQDFWRRWHITLSRFLKEYIYIPLGGNRKGALRTYSNLLATFILGGIWHGAGWTFVFWGFLHGLALVIHRAWQSIGFKLPKVFAWFITFNFINISWVFFRAKEWDDALKVLDGMFLAPLVLDYHWQESLSFLPLSFGVWLQNIYAENEIILWMGIVSVIVAFLPNTSELSKRFKPSVWTLLWASLLVTYAILDMNKVSEFLYFNF